MDYGKQSDGSITQLGAVGDAQKVAGWDGTEQVMKTANLVWDTGSLSWVKQTSTAGGAGAVTLADGADAAQGTTSDAAWVSGNGTVVALLKNIAVTTAKVPGLSIPIYDYTALTQDATHDTWAFKTGGSGGSTVATVTITYTDSTKATVASVAKT